MENFLPYLAVGSICMCVCEAPSPTFEAQLDVWAFEPQARKERSSWRRYGWGHAGSLLHYPLEEAQHWIILLVVNLRKQNCWIIVPCGQVIDTQQFKEICCLHLHAYESINSLKTLKMKMLCSCEMSLRNYPTTWHHNQKTWSLNSSVGTSDHCFHLLCVIYFVL
jgi:hypothetical protein